jgi:GNAT superfamily N-acetyltransferase
MYAENAPAGYAEVRKDSDGSVELAYFGLVPEYVGRGLGKHLLSVVVERIWEEGTGRIWLHTCTLDHPSALPNYLKRGFVPFRTEVYEVD